jgi:xanthine dehydrogenase YagR molybdenum-binding subunit
VSSEAPYTGRSLERVDGRLKVTGKATYSSDVPVAHLAHAVVVGSTISRGRVAAIDARAAERAPGVVAVLTHDNAPRLPGATKRSEPNERILQLLQDGEVHYDGQPVAVVVGETLEAAQHGASLVKVRYDAAAPRFDLERERDGAFVPPASGPRGPSDSSRGDFDAAFGSAPKRFEATYTTPIEHHHPMELHSTVAVWQGEERLTLYDATQGISNVQKRAAAIFGLPRENVRVVSHFLGGGFGCKGSPWSHVMLAAMAARATGRAVKLVITRPQMFLFVGHRPRTIQRLALGARDDGALVAMRHDVLSHTSTFDTFMEPAGYGTRMLYACDNVKTSHRLVRLDVSTPTFTRAPGEASGSFALESALDELAYVLEMDPLALRLRNHADQDPDERKPWSSKTLKECYRQGAERFGWSRRKPEPRSMRDGKVLVGLGMATATYPARQSAASALARVRADGTALVLTGSQDLGTGTYTIMTQIAADGLRLPLDKVHFDLGDTKYPEAPLSAGSQTASSVGSAVRLAAEAARAELTRLAVADARSPLYGLSPEEVDAADGHLLSRRDRRKRDAYADIVKRSGKDAVEVVFHEKEKEDRKRLSTHSFGAQFAEVRVDEDLGVVRVSRLVGAFSAGRFLNRKTGRSQLIGGIVWGIGLALEEHSERDPRSGRFVTRELQDYHVPVNADVPPIDVIMIDEDDPHVNDIGAKGIGEIGIVGVGAAIANAVYHATGKRIRDLPITVDKLVGQPSGRGPTAAS